MNDLCITVLHLTKMEIFPLSPNGQDRESHQKVNSLGHFSPISPTRHHIKRNTKRHPKRMRRCHWPFGWGRGVFDVSFWDTWRVHSLQFARVFITWNLVMDDGWLFFFEWLQHWGGLKLCLMASRKHKKATGHELVVLFTFSSWNSTTLGNMIHQREFLDLHWQALT